MKRLLVALLLSGLSVSLYAAVHPKLIEAQKLLVVAEKKVHEAQLANEFDLGGWAAKAEKAIGRARNQIKLATEAADGDFVGDVAALPSVSPQLDSFFHKHPRLAEAQRYVNAAYALIGEAQKDNGFDMQGHAQKAKDDLDRASEDIRKAAQTGI